MTEKKAFTLNLYCLLEEAFETHHGVFLDKKISLLDTLKR